MGQNEISWYLDVSRNSNTSPPLTSHIAPKKLWGNMRLTRTKMKTTEISLLLLLLLAPYSGTCPIACSMILRMTEQTEMGRQFFANFLSPPLNINVVLATLSDSGM